MIKICVPIGEGESERYFLASLAENQLGFKALSEKNPDYYENDKGDILWLFQFPPQKSHPLGGKDRLKNHETYRIVNLFVQNTRNAIDPGAVGAEVHYRVIVDCLECDPSDFIKKHKDISDAFVRSKAEHKSFHCFPVENEMECWYFAGLTENFPYIKKSERKRFLELIEQKPENIPEVKKAFWEIVDTDQIAGAIRAGQAVAKYFDVEKASRNSKSFRTFWRHLQESELV